MISSIFGYFYKNLFPGRKRTAEDVLESQPPQKVIKYGDYGPEMSLAAMASETKENNVIENPEEEVSVVAEVPRQWAAPRRAIRHASCGPTTSTPVLKPASSKMPRGRSSPQCRLVDLTKEGSSSKSCPTSNDEIQVLKTIRHVPIERTGAFGKTQTPVRHQSPRQPLKRILGRNFNQRHLRGEMLEYRKLLDKYRNMPSFLSTTFTIPAIKVIDAQPRKIDLVDLTQDFRVDRRSEQEPSSRALVVYNKMGAASTLAETPVARVNSLQDFLKFHPSASAVPDCKEILSRYQTMTKERQRMAELEETRLAVLSPHNQKAVCAALEERVRDYMKISEPPILEIEEVPEISYVLPELSEEQEARVTKALRPTPPQEILADKFGLRISRHDMSTLKGLNWLNDEVINFYMNLIMQARPTVYAFNTFFYPKLLSGGHAALKRWTRKVDLFSHEMVLIPVHLGMHWCMSVVDFPKKEIRYYDSMLAANDRCLNAILQYLKAESFDKKKVEFDSTGWSLTNVEDIPQQMNSSDCGVFACTFAEHLARQAPLLFTQDHMPYFRRKMVLEILDGALIT